MLIRGNTPHKLKNRVEKVSSDELQRSVKWQLTVHIETWSKTFFLTCTINWIIMNKSTLQNFLVEDLLVPTLETTAATQMTL